MSEGCRGAVIWPDQLAVFRAANEAPYLPSESGSQTYFLAKK
jgi:hypothetical protein